MTERLHFHFSLSCTGDRNGNPLQCSCLENPRDGGAWWAAVYEVPQGQTQLKRLSSSSSSTVVLFLIFWGTSKLFSIVDAPVYIPTNKAQGFCFLYIFVIICYFLSFRKYPFSLVWGISHCWFWFAFFWWSGKLNTLHMCCPSICLFGKFLFRSSAHFSIKLLWVFFVFYSVVWVLHIFWILTH